MSLICSLMDALMLRVGPVLLKNNALLAPMAGITDLPFRRIAARFGAGLVTSEMIASADLVNGRVGTAHKAEIDPAAGIASIQIAGREADLMAEAARRAEGNGAEIIDINMGCPAKKVTTGYSGSALMREPDHALSLIEAVVGAVKAPVTLKMRLGWDDDQLNAADIAVRAEAAGIQLITIHGRTRCQFYKGEANWRAIRPVKEAVNVPVIANGDIIDVVTAREALDHSGADGVMIGRGAQGAPWVPAEIAAGLEGRVFAAPTGNERTGLMVEHYEAMLSFYGIDLGVRVARKHLGWWLERIPGGAATRAKVMRLKDPADVIQTLTTEPSNEAEIAA